MPGPIHAFLAADHERLDELLTRAVAAADGVDLQPYAQFRRGLLRHIAMEEKVLLPLARARRGGEPLPITAQLRADHAALAGLLVPTATRAIIGTIRGILATHDELEEQRDGLYEVCERLAGSEVEDVVARLRAVPEVPVAPHCDEPHVQQHLTRVLRARMRPGCGGD